MPTPSTATVNRGSRPPGGLSYSWNSRFLDAATCESLAAVQLPQRVAMGFCGNWTPLTETDRR
ncbi:MULTISPECIES: carotenoid oxygenase family protein [unclassified Mycobacterium]|uniref:carotenoid oxygenase family protein n=1 Tax=unclassified Mycobacterium TaxID=2642494 RepID=UPI0004229FFD|nr:MULTISPECIES: carotenoid oxygenase family protein [unclassified Mycobacterium]